MNNIARLTLFFSILFIVSFALAGTFEYISLVVDAATVIPAGPPVQLGQFSEALQKIFPLILYCAILLGLSYSARRRIAPAAAIVSVFILAGGAALGLSLGLRSLKTNGMDAPLESRGGTKPLGVPGLILSQRDVVVALLGDPGASESSRVISIPGRPLIYQEKPSGPTTTVAPFREGDPALMQGLLVDSALVAEQFETQLERGIFPFALYGGAIILLLSSLRFVLTLSSWPLANLFCGALAFRGVLAFQTFIDSRSVQTFIIAFFDNRIEGAIISPIIFAGLALLLLLYTFLVSVARGGFPSRAPRQNRRQARQPREKRQRRQGDG
ncbi:MAG: hypothetical protein LBU16_02715 [Treponema sp.]|jgi:hypothetical protein|nr:hypothetical protein [Treponema sp.]